VVWRTSKFKSYANVLLVEYDKGFDWDKNNLKQFYRKNIDQFRLYPAPVTGTWLLDDNTALMTTFEIMYEDHILNITISEVKKHNYVRTLAYIDPEK
jgi:hypothetical protein